MTEQWERQTTVDEGNGSHYIIGTAGRSNGKEKGCGYRAATVDSDETDTGSPSRCCSIGVLRSMHIGQLAHCFSCTSSVEVVSRYYADKRTGASMQQPYGEPLSQIFGAF